REKIVESRLEGGDLAPEILRSPAVVAGRFEIERKEKKPLEVRGYPLPGRAGGPPFLCAVHAGHVHLEMLLQFLGEIEESAGAPGAGGPEGDLGGKEKELHGGS